MLLGHVGAASAARPAARKAPPGVLLVAGEGLDLLCYGLVAAGIRHWALVAEARLLAGIAIDRRGRR